MRRLFLICLCATFLYAEDMRLASKKAQHFRVLVWSKGGKKPDFITNWLDITADKIYTLQPDHLIPVVLMPGMGC